MGRPNDNMTSTDYKNIDAISEFYKLKQQLYLTLEERARYEKVIYERRFKPISGVRTYDKWTFI